MKTTHYLILITLLLIGYGEAATAQPRLKKHPLVEKLFSKNRRVFPNQQYARVAMTTPLPRSINYNWNPALNNWHLQDTSDYQYDAQGRVTEKITSDGNNKLRITYLYDLQGNLLEESYYAPAGNGWQITQKSISTFNTNGEVILRLDLNYSGGILSDTLMGERVIFTNHPTLSQPATKTTQFFNSLNHQWENNKLNVFEYNGMGQVIRAVEAEWVLNTWDTIGQIINTWDANNRILAFTLSLYDAASGYEPYIRLSNIQYQTWNGTFERSLTSYYLTSLFFNNLWVPTQKTYTTFDANGGFVQLDSSAFFGTGFGPDTRYSYIINNQGHYEGAKLESWQNNSWVIDSHDDIQYTYNTLGQIEQIINRYYDNSLSAYVNETRKDFMPGIVQGLEPVELEQNVKIETYPNPATELTTLRLEISEDEPLKVMLLEMNGRIILQLEEQIFSKGSHEISLPLHHLSLGSYLIRVQGIKRSTHLRLLKQ